MITKEDIDIGTIYRGRKENGDWKYVRLLRIVEYRLFFDVCDRRGIPIGVKENTILDNFMMWATEVYRH